jgi:hypothetical protein
MNQLQHPSPAKKSAGKIRRKPLSAPTGGISGNNKPHGGRKGRKPPKITGTPQS